MSDTYDEKELKEIADKLIPFEKERLTGWQGVAGAAYNVISTGLARMGLLDAQWQLTKLGEAVADYCRKENDNVG